MELAFAHLEARCSAEGAGGAAAAWAALLAAFERTILHTHRSKFSQFLVFYMCTKYPDPCARLFVEFLLLRLHVGAHGVKCLVPATGGGAVKCI
jgi:RNA polymerase I-specific transcription initiation factor RRN3